MSSSMIISARPLVLSVAFFSAIFFSKTASGLPMRPELYSLPSSGATTMAHSSAGVAYLGLSGLPEAEAATKA